MFAAHQGCKELDVKLESEAFLRIDPSTQTDHFNAFGQMMNPAESMEGLAVRALLTCSHAK